MHQKGVVLSPLLICDTAVKALQLASKSIFHQTFICIPGLGGIIISACKGYIISKAGGEDERRLIDNTEVIQGQPWACSGAWACYMPISVNNL